MMMNKQRTWPTTWINENRFTTALLIVCFVQGLWIFNEHFGTPAPLGAEPLSTYYVSDISALSTTLSSGPKNIQKKAMLSKGQIPYISQFSILLFNPGDSVKTHIDANLYEAYYVESGNGYVRFHDNPTEIYNLKQGSYFVTLPRLPHEIINNGTEPLVLLCFGIIE
eukprot:TRINITY_DN1129_c0_g6_i1.p1 TRINITY_DN1129_c0_g6~~TRINITY_DN1129_c0_g6_i1.p1  ORF type:complete len:167 (-),score=24.22 TRINITY_DN1129_c0_g6_i1:316-816(-)